MNPEIKNPEFYKKQSMALVIGLVEAPARAFCSARHEVPARALRFAEDLSGDRVR